METIDRYVAYATAFEEAYASDDWSKLEPFFTEDAVYGECIENGIMNGAARGRR